MLPPPPLRKLIVCLEGNNIPHIPLNSHEIGEESLSYMTELLALAAIPPEFWRRETALIALWRAFLSLIPASLLENPDERIREPIKKRLEHLMGETPDDEDLRLVVSIVNRLQRYQREGRRATSINIGQVTQKSLLVNQSLRCANCGYKFRRGDLEPDNSSSDPDDRPKCDSPLNVLDRSPSKINRKAALDHILPVYLAGDHKGNWQILCYTCNSGKSDMVYGFENRAWFGGTRKLDLTKVSPQLFYMVLNRDRNCRTCSRGVQQVELRLMRKDMNGADLYPNLGAYCVDCLNRHSV